jgi:hypothetical protein
MQWRASQFATMLSWRRRMRSTDCGAGTLMPSIWHTARMRRNFDMVAQSFLHTVTRELAPASSALRETLHYSFQYHVHLVGSHTSLFEATRTMSRDSCKRTLEHHFLCSHCNPSMHKMPTSNFSPCANTLIHFVGSSDRW